MLGKSSAGTRRGRVEGSEYSYTVLFEPAEEGGYVVTCPALPGVVTQGETLEELEENLKDALRAMAMDVGE